MGLKFKDPDIEEEKKKKKEEEEKKKKKKEEKKEPKRREALLQKAKSKPFEELKTKMRHKRILSPISKERRVSKRILLKLAAESSFSSAEDEASAIVAQLMNAAAPAKFAPRPSRLREKRIKIMEQPPQEQLEHPEAKASDKDEDPEIRRKGKKPMKKTPMQPSKESTPSFARRALFEVA